MVFIFSPAFVYRFLLNSTGKTMGFIFELIYVMRSFFPPDLERTICHEGRDASRRNVP